MLQLFEAGETALIHFIPLFTPRYSCAEGTNSFPLVFFSSNSFLTVLYPLALE